MGTQTTTHYQGTQFYELSRVKFNGHNYANKSQHTSSESPFHDPWPDLVLVQNPCIRAQSLSAKPIKKLPNFFGIDHAGSVLGSSLVRHFN